MIDEVDTCNVVSISSVSSSDGATFRSDSEDSIDEKYGPDSAEEALARTGYAQKCDVKALKEVLRIVRFEPGNFVCRRGDDLLGMYIVLDVGGVMLNESSGDIIGFGELIDCHGLVYSASKSADTVKCIKACHCAFLSRGDFSEPEWQAFRDAYLRSNIPLIQFVDIQSLRFEYEVAEAGDTVVSLGQVIVVIDGVIFSRNEGDRLHYYPGHILGVLERLGGSERSRFEAQSRCIYAFMYVDSTHDLFDNKEFSIAIMESAYQRSVMKEVNSKVKPRMVLYRCESQGRITLAPVVPTAVLSYDVGNLVSVNDFTITGHLGIGSTARVFECCSDVGKVALKMVYKSKAKESLHREIVALQDLKHDNIVNLKLVINDPRLDVAFLVEEMATKGSLVGIVMRTSLECQRVTSDVIRALSHVHSNGYVHRDVKPANILIMSDGKAKLTDFGCAVRVNESSKTAKFMGTPAFMAPELFVSGKITPAVDVWSLVGTMHYVVYGALPFGVDGFVMSESVLYSAPAMGTTMTPRCQKMMNDNWTNDDISRFKHFCKEGFRKDPSKRITLEELGRHDWLIYT